MMPFLLSEEIFEPVESPQKLSTDAFDKQVTANEIMSLVEEHQLSILEAVTHWMEERSIPETQYARFIPSTIIEQLKLEALEDKLLRPSLASNNTSNSLDFLYG